MPEPRVDRISERPFEELVQAASGQAVVMAREQLDLARRELTEKAKQAGGGVGMVGGAAVLALLASGTGTAAVVLLLARRSGASAAALGVTGAYAGASALLAREGLARIREATPLVPEDAVGNAKKTLGSAKRGGKSAQKPAGRSTPRQSSKSTSAKRQAPRATPRQSSKSTSAKRPALRAQPERPRRRASQR